MDYNKIRSLCVDKRISLRTLAARIEMSQPGFMRMLKNQTMSVETLEKVAAVLRVPPTVFFSQSEGMPVTVEESPAHYSAKSEADHIGNIDKNVAAIVAYLHSQK